MRLCRLSRTGLFVGLSLAVIFTASSHAQTVLLDNTTAPPTEGVGHDFIKMLNETVNPANGAVTIHIELPVPEARGVQLPIAEVYNSSGVEHVVGSQNGGAAWATDTQVSNGSGWSYSLPTLTAALGKASFNNPGPPPVTDTCSYISSYVFNDLNGTSHSLPISIAQSNSGGAGNCSQVQGTPIPYNVLSGSDDFFQAITTGVCSSCIPQLPNPVTVAGPDGTVYQFSSFDIFNNGVESFWSPASSIEDRNGNVARLSANRGVYGVMSLSATDTAGRTAVSVTALSGNSNTITVSGISGAYTQTWESIPFNFNVTSTPVGSYPCTGVGVPAASGSNYVLKSITLPNGQSYQFQYDALYGLLSQITYPSGGYVSYDWSLNSQSEAIRLFEFPTGWGTPETCDTRYDYPAIYRRTVSYDGVHVAEVQTFSYQTTWPTSTSSTWATKQTVVNNTDYIRNASYQQTYTYTWGGLVSPPNAPTGLPSQIPIEQSITTQDFGGATLKTVYKHWNDVFLLGCELEELNNTTSLISATWYGYSSGGQLSDTKQYDYGVVTNTAACNGSAPSSNPTREVSTVYQSFLSTKIFPSAPSIFDRPSSVKTSGNGVLAAETDYTYDGATVGCAAVNGTCVSSSLTGHDATNYSTSNNNRGNATSKTVQCLQTGCTNVLTTYAFDETGQIVSVTDPCGNGTCSDMTVGTGATHTASYYYADSYTAGTPSGNTNAYLTKTVDHLNHVQVFSYDFNNGQLTVAKDQNDINANRAGTTYTYNDPFARPRQVNYPDGGQTNIDYNDAVPSVTTTRLIDSASSTNLKTTTVMDGMRHPTQTQVTSDPGGTTYVDTSYDGSGHVYTQSNPYRNTSPSQTDGTTTFAYDPLGRTVTVTRPDGSDVDSAYSGNCTTVTDEIGALRKSCSDSFGRVIEVDEPGSGAQIETAGSALLSIGGSEQSATVSATPGKGSVTVYGSEQSTTYFPCGVSSCPTTLWDSGSVTVTVNGFSAYGNYNQGSTPSSVASGLASNINSNGSSPVTATASGSVVNLTAKTSGASTNYSLSVTSSTTYPQYFSSPSFSASKSGSTLTGGQNAGLMYDSGTLTISVNSGTSSVASASASYANGSNASSVASTLAAELNASSVVSATLNGSSITVTSIDAGSDSNYSIASTATWNSQDFSHASFSVSGPSSLAGGTDANLGASPLVTRYSYDALDNLTCAVQKGTDTTAFTTCAAAPPAWRPRSFVYDSLSRLTSATNPEAGTITYSYDLNNNLASRTTPTPGQTGTAKTTHVYTYDVENRELTETHAYNPDGTIKFAYDGSTNLTACGQNPPTVTATNPIHRRSQMCGARSGSSWSFDPMGRPILASTRQVGSVQKVLNSSFGYYSDGSLKSITYPSGNVLTYTVGGAGRPIAVADAQNNTFVSSATYAPHGALAGMKSGSSGAIVTTNYYNNRLQPTLLSAANGSNVALSICYDFHSHIPINVGSGTQSCQFNAYTTGNNGNVFQVLNKTDSTRDTTFIYDALNRLVQANTVNTTSTNCWGEVYALDNWGNLTSIAGASGMGSCKTELFSGGSATTTNQVSNFCYDAAGNLAMTTGACPLPLGTAITPTYNYDAENRLSSTAGFSYYYDANGARMEKLSGSTGTMYWLAPNGDYLSESDLSGNINEEYIYANGERIARIDQPSGTVHYYFSDKLNSASVITDPNGIVEEQYFYYPFGGLVSSIGSDPNHYKFNGKERDDESDFDQFGARYYAFGTGRFTTADWAAKPTNVPYANFGNPQSLNLYSYVNNNPTTTRDPDGHCPVDGCVLEFLAAEGGIAVWNYLAGGAVLGMTAAAAGASPSGNAGFVSPGYPSYYHGELQNANGTSIYQKDSGSQQGSGEKNVPNPNGSKGAPDHQQTADEEASQMGGDREVRVQTPGGEKGSRVIDAAKVDENGKVTEARQVIRPNKDGTPPAREVRAARDIEKATGVKPKMVPVRPCNYKGCNK